MPPQYKPGGLLGRMYNTAALAVATLEHALSYSGHVPAYFEGSYLAKKGSRTVRAKVQDTRSALPHAAAFNTCGAADRPG